LTIGSILSEAFSFAFKKKNQKIIIILALEKKDEMGSLLTTPKIIIIDTKLNMVLIINR